MENILVKQKMNMNVLANVEPMNDVKDLYFAQQIIPLRQQSMIAFSSGILVHLTLHIVHSKASNLDMILVEMITTQLKVS